LKIHFLIQPKSKTQKQYFLKEKQQIESLKWFIIIFHLDLLNLRHLKETLRFSINLEENLVITELATNIFQLNFFVGWYLMLFGLKQCRYRR
jgi:hypothetical protein